LRKVTAGPRHSAPFQALVDGDDIAVAVATTGQASGVVHDSQTESTLGRPAPIILSLPQAPDLRAEIPGKEYAVETWALQLRHNPLQDSNLGDHNCHRNIFDSRHGSRSITLGHRHPVCFSRKNGSRTLQVPQGRARTARPRRAAPSVDAVAGVAPRGAKITLVPTHAAMHNDQAFQASSPKTSGAGLRAGPFFGLLPTGDGHDRAAPRRSWLARMSRCDRPPVCPSGTPPFDRAAIKERRLCSLRTGGSNPSVDGSPSIAGRRSGAGVGVCPCSRPSLPEQSHAALFLPYSD